MEITYYGLSCFRLTERGMTTIVVDPYDHTVIGFQQLKLKADIVTVSHDAPGHNFVKAVKGHQRIISSPGEYEIGGVFITAVQTGKKGKSNKDNKQNLLCVFEYNGVTVAHLGDLNRVPSQTEVEALGAVNVALVPVGGGGGLNAAKAAEVISLLEPGVVIPMHFRTEECNLKLDPLSKFLKEMGIGRNAESQPSLKVKESSVPDETRVVVLDYIH